MKKVLFLLIFFLTTLFLSSYALAQKITTTTLPITDSEKITDIYSKTTNILNNLNKIFQMEKYKIDIGSTFYNLGENASVFVKIFQLDNGQSVNNAFCDVMIFYPNKTFYMSSDLPYLPNSRGIYLKNDIQLTETGIYPLDIECVKPVNETSQFHYFRKQNSYFYLGNSSGNISTSITLTNVGIDNFICYPSRFSEMSQDFEEYRFISNITDISGYFQKSGSGSAFFTIVYKFYLKTPYGEILLGSTLNTTSISASSPTMVIFPDICACQQSIPENSYLEVEWCIKKETMPISDVQFFFNSTEYNSSFKVNALTRNVSVDFVIGGSSELNVKPNINQMIISVNDTIKNETLNLYNYLVLHNSSVFDKLISVQNDISNANSSLSNLIVSVNDTVLNVNGSLADKLISIQNDLIAINNSINNLNITGIFDELNVLKNDIYSLNNTLLDTNSSIHYKLILIQNDLSNIYDLISNSNSSIMNKLYSIQDDLYGIDSSLNSNFTNLNNSMIWWFNETKTEVHHIEDMLYNITIGELNVIANITDATIDRIARKVMEYFYALKDKLLSIQFKLW